MGSDNEDSYQLMSINREEIWAEIRKILVWLTFAATCNEEYEIQRSWNPTYLMLGCNRHAIILLSIFFFFSFHSLSFSTHCKNMFFFWFSLEISAITEASFVFQVFPHVNLKVGSGAGFLSAVSEALIPVWAVTELSSLNLPRLLFIP